MPQIVLDDPDGTLAMFRESVATLAARHPGPASVRSRRADGGRPDMALWSAMAEAGWMGLLVPEELGGVGLGAAEQAVLSESLGRDLVSESMAECAVFASAMLTDAPQSDERDRLLSGLLDGSMLIVPARQEAPLRSSERPLRALADGDFVVLDGDVSHADAAIAASDFLVVAADDHGAVLVSVPANAADLDVTSRASVDGGSIGALSFSGCRLPAGKVLARASDVAALTDRPTLLARLALAAELAGIAGKAVEMTIAYTKERVQFGKPIASFQAIQHRLVEMWSDAEFACASVANAVEKLKADDEVAARLAVLAAKARCGDAAVSICRRAVHLHGAMGFTDEHDIGLYLKRAVSLNATLGQPESLRLEFVDLERAA